MNDFILVRRKCKKPNKDSLVLRVSAEAFMTVDKWSALTGLTKSKIIDKALAYCQENLTFIDSEEYGQHEEE